MPPDNTRPAFECAPSTFVPDTVAEKICNAAKPVPLVSILNTIPPAPAPPPPYVVPYNVLPDKTSPAIGYDGSLTPDTPNKCRVVKAVPSVLTLKIDPKPLATPPADVVPYNVLPDKTRLPSGLAPSLFVFGV